MAILHDDRHESSRERGGPRSVNPKLELCGELTHLSTTYLKLAELDTTVVLYGVRPATGLHCLDSIIADDSIKLGLTPYV